MAIATVGNPAKGIIEAGSVLEVTGLGIVMIGKFINNVTSKSRFGPFEVDVDFTVTALSGEVQYIYYSNSGVSSDFINSGEIAFSFKKKNITYMPFLPQTTQTASIRTYNTMMTLPGDFDAIAFIIVNVGVSYTHGGDCVAVSESNASKTVPLINGVSYNVLASAGTQNGFIPITYGGIANPVIPAGTPDSPSFLISDFVDLSSIPRTDSGAFPLIIRRRYINNTVYSIRNTNSATATDSINTVMNPHEYYHLMQPAIDGVSSPASFTATWSIGGGSSLLIDCGCIIKSRISGHTIVIAGDSINQGASETGTDLEKANSIVGSWNHKAFFNLSKKFNYPVGYVNVAKAGNAPPLYTARLKSLISAGIPVSKLIYPPWSPNPFPPTSSISTAQDLYDYSMQYKFDYILETPTPYYAYETARASTRLSIISASKPGNLVIDWNNSPLYKNPVSENTCVLPYTLDNTHPNSAGHSLMGTYSEPTIFEFVNN